MTGRDWVVRPFRWWHIEQAARLDAALFDPDVWSAETFWSELAAPGRWYRVAVAADPAGPTQEKIVGYAGIAVAGAEADVQTIAVAPTAQGTGLGRTLLTVLIRAAADLGATSLMLEVRADNAAAIGLYRSAGFDQIATRRRYYQPGDIDALIMRLRPLPGDRRS